MQAVQTPVIPAVAELIRRRPGTISLGQGVVFYPPPPEVREGVERFFQDAENHKYGAVAGVPALLQAIERKLGADNGFQPSAGRRVVVTAGSNMAFMHAVLAVVDPGDEVILPLPYYFNHEMAVTMAGGRVVEVPTDASGQLDPDAVRRAITRRTRAVVTVSPNNPTGAVYPETTLREVNGICRDAGVYHVSDEAYEYFTYEGATHFSPGAIEGSEEHTISLFSLSKAYGFASWRVGYMAFPAHLAEAVGKIHDTVLICAPVVSQLAAAAALRVGSDYCREHIGTIAGSRAEVLRALEPLRPLCQVAPAEGALYFLLRLATDRSDMEVVERLVREHGVAAMPGSAFGLTTGCQLRISYGALRPELVREGAGRLVEGLRSILNA